MGVSRSDWVVIGVDIGMEHYDDENSDFFDQYAMQSGEGDITFLIDGMSGDYFIVGEVVAHGDEYDGFGITEIPLENSERFKQIADDVLSFIKIKFDVPNIEPKIIVLTHWT